MKRITATALLFLFLAACQSNEIGHSRDVNQDEICQTYLVNYDEHRNETTITAFFRFAGPSGTTLILDSTSKVEMNGEPMSEVQNASTGCSYTKTVTGKLPDKETVFSFTDLTGKQYDNRLNFRSMETDPLPDTLRHADGLTIYFADKPEGRKEDLTVEISDDSTTVSETWKQVYFKKAKFPQEKFNKLHGNIRIVVERQGTFELKQHAHAGGYIYTEYNLTPKKSVIAD